MQFDFESGHNLELALPKKWWERHFRGYEATLPIYLMKNLAVRFNQLPTIQIEEEKTGRESVEYRVRKTMTETIENSQYDKTRSMSRLSDNDGTDDLYELLGFRDDLPLEDELS